MKRERPSASTTAPPSATVEPSSRRAVIYLRVSTDRQVNKAQDPEGYSLPAQREACLRKAQGLSAEVVEEYVDYGETAKFSDRPAFQDMVKRVRQRQDVDYVIVHKLNRFARNRRDDANFLFELHTAGAKLVSVSENIDDSPSGRLLHGIMASIAEYESANLASEALKGMNRKAESGGTPGRCPLGYLNIEQIVNDRRFRGVSFDENRAGHVRWAFEAYATGDWSVESLARELASRGLRTRPTKVHGGKPLALSGVHAMLRNRYYIGFVTFRGVEHAGRHEPLIDIEIFEKVQAILSSHAIGEKQRVHRHYLKSSVYCGGCGQRLCLTLAKDRYLYFFCIGRQKRRTGCLQRYLPADEIEVAVEAYYGHLELSPLRVQAIREQLRRELATSRESLAEEARRQGARVVELQAQREKLLQAFYSSALPLDLMRVEQDRIAQELEHARRQVAASQVEFDTVESTVERALQLAADCRTMYRLASPSVRRQLNQAFFKRVYVVDAEVVDAELQEPFAGLLAEDSAGGGGKTTDGTRKQSRRFSNRSDVSSRTAGLAAPTGFEPVPPP